VRAPDDRSPADAACPAWAARRGRLRQETVDLLKPPLQGHELGAPLADELVVEAVALVHLEHDSAEVSNSVLSRTDEAAPLPA
jgi:hypothetical protein